MFYTVKGILADGSDISYTIHQDKTRYVLEDTYGTLIDENGDVYGTDTELGIPVRYLFIGDTYENFIADYKVESLYEYNEKEKITSKEVRDGIIYLETESPKESVEMHDFSYGLASDDADFIISEYTIDSETKEIFEIKTYAVLEEQKTLYYDVILDRECKEYTPDKEITDGVFGNDSRTISVIADAGTPNEKTYTQTVTKGSSINLYIPEEFEQKVYRNAECTENVEIDRTKDQTVYLKRIAESDTPNGEYEYPSEDNTSVVYESKLGYSLTYDPTAFTLDETGESDIFTYNTSEELAAPIYLSFQKYTDMDAQTLAEGLALQSGIDGVEVQDAYFGADNLMVKTVYIEKEVNGVRQIQIFYAIPVEEGSLLLDIGTYVGVSMMTDAKLEEMLGTLEVK